MPGPVQELKIGPFSGGINQFSDKSAIADNELEDCVNFDIDLDGSLKSRSPWSLLTSTIATDNVSLVPNGTARILGTFVYGGYRLVFYSKFDTVAGNTVYKYTVDGPSAGTHTAIAGLVANSTYSTAIRSEDIIYLIPTPNSALGGASYVLSTGVATQIATMPGGNTALVYKDSLYIGGGTTTTRSRVRFSALANYASWPGTNFFDIDPGAGDGVQDFLLYQDNVLIAKDNGTYVLAYDTNPAQAVVKQINNNIGVKGPYCLVPYENSVFFLQYSTVYEMVNYDFTRVSTKIPFDLDVTIDNPYQMSGGLTWVWPTFISRVGDRLVARFYNRLYVYHLRIRSWTRWETNDPNIKYMGPMFELDRTNSTTVMGWETFISITALNNIMDSSIGFISTMPGGYCVKIFKYEDRYESVIRENGNIAVTPVDINCFMLSKVYDIGLSHRFKRLMHWGVDMVTARDVTGTLYPLSIAYRVTWAQLHGLTWAQLQSWGYPTFIIPSTTQIASIISRVDRRYIRFPKSLRFRLLQFKVEVPTQGNTTDGPARVYTITAFIGSKELVPAAVN